MTNDKGEEGVWRTLPNKAKVFIKNGQSLSEAIAENLRRIDEEQRRKKEEEEAVKNLNIRKTSASEFKEKFDEAKATVKEKDAWRVSSDYTEDDYKEMDCYVTEAGSTYAIHNGDIVSVCKKYGTSDSGRALLKDAVSKGGIKLDAFDGIYGFYTKCGFEPISWCEFNEEFAPQGWNSGRDERENIIFYKYTGKKFTKPLDEFLSDVKPSADYDAAQKKRDDSL